MTPLGRFPLPVLVVAMLSESRRVAWTPLDHQPWSVFVANRNKSEKVVLFFYSSWSSEDVKLPSCSSWQAADIIQVVITWQRSQRGWKAPRCAQSHLSLLRIRSSRCWHGWWDGGGGKAVKISVAIIAESRVLSQEHNGPSVASAGNMTLVANQMGPGLKSWKWVNWPSRMGWSWNKV